MDYILLEFFLFIVIIIIVVFRDNINSIFKHCIWVRNIKDKHSYNEELVLNCLNTISKEAFDFTVDNIPYGRSKWFLLGNETFAETVDINSTEFYGYSPVRSRTELEFREYGLLLTQNGVYECWQIDEKDNEKKYKTQSTFCPFDGLWKVSWNCFSAKSL